MRSWMILLGFVAAATACGDDGGTPSPDAPVVVPDGGAGAADAAPADASLSFDPLEFNAAGCVTPASAYPFCCERPGGDVDECQGEAGEPASICGFMAGCGLTDLSQCSIDCTMAPSVFCIEQSHADCLVGAYETDDCTAAAACTGWIYFGG